MTIKKMFGFEHLTKNRSTEGAKLSGHFLEKSS